MFNYRTWGILIIIFISVIVFDFVIIKKTAKFNKRFKAYKKSASKKQYISYELDKDIKERFDYYMAHTPEALHYLEIELTNELDNDDSGSFLNTIVSVGIPSLALLAAILAVLAPEVNLDTLMNLIKPLIILLIILTAMYAIKNLTTNIKTHLMKRHLTMVRHVKQIKKDSASKRNK